MVNKGRADAAVPAVSIANYTFSYATSDAPTLENITLEVKQGQCVVLTGGSGCGKTTLTRLINGLIPVVYEGDSTGSVSIMGRPIEQWSMGDLPACVGSVFQNPRSQFVNMDTTSEIAFGCENLGVPRTQILERVSRSTNDLGIPHLLDRDVEALSGGQKQMVILASAHATHPDIFVLDEPTASLDVQAMQRLGRAVAQLKAQGKTVIVSEHRLWWLADVADRIVVMEQGRISDDWTAREFASLPLARRTRQGLRSWTLDEIDLQLSLRSASEAPGRKPCISREEPRLETPCVSVRNLCAGYRRTPNILRNLNLDLQPGRAVGIVGRNGAGKTTLARCIAGLLREHSGSVDVDGARIPAKKRAGRAYLVMQEPGYQLFSNTVEGELNDAAPTLNKKHPAGMKKRHDRIAEMQAALGLQHLSDRHPLSLSGGERQRLSIAAGLLHEASALVMDEPTSGLDYGNMRRVVQQVNQAKGQGLSVCIVSHDYEFLCQACDDIAILEDGGVSRMFPLDETTLPQLKAQFGLAAKTS